MTAGGLVIVKTNCRSSYLNFLMTAGGLAIVKTNCRSSYLNFLMTAGGLKMVNRFLASRTRQNKNNKFPGPKKNPGVKNGQQYQ